MSQSRNNSTILNKLLENSDDIICHLKKSNLVNYNYTQKQLLRTDVSKDTTYQTKFNGFYKMRQRPKDWYEFFFSLLESQKFNRSISFKEVLTEIHGVKKRVEPSFSSKLIATINSDMPVYDKEVAKNLDLKIPYPSMPNKRRISKLIDVYSEITDKNFEMRQSSEFNELKTDFDIAFPQYAHFTDVKKLDLFLWQMRGN